MAGTAVFGIYKTRRHVENAVEELKCSGFLNTDISVLLPDEDGGQDLRHQKHTKAPEGATSGVVAGGALGGTLGWLAGIGAVAIPGVGHLIAAGPILGALSGAAVAGALGAIAGALIGLGIPEYEAKRYEGEIERGGILLSVHTADANQRARAKRILEETGAAEVAAVSEVKGDSAAGVSPNRAHGSVSG